MDIQPVDESSQSRLEVEVALPVNVEEGKGFVHGLRSDLSNGMTLQSPVPGVGTSVGLRSIPGTLLPRLDIIGLYLDIEQPRV